MKRRNRVAEGGLSDLLLISAGFFAALKLYDALLTGGLTTEEKWIGCGASIFAFWVATQLKQWDAGTASDTWVYFVEQFCFGTGINLLFHALMTYGLRTRRTPFLVIAGSLFSAVLLAVARKWRVRAHPVQRRLLLIGFDTVTAGVVRALGWPIAAVSTEDPALVPEGVPILNDGKAVEAVLRDDATTNVLVSSPDWARKVSPSALFHSREGGTTVEEVATVYERLFSRVCCQRLRPMNLVLSPTLLGDSRTMAIQAIYTNLIGLILLLAATPVMLLTAAALMLFSGPGRIFETVECAGFQYIPFRLLRFRTTGKNGVITTTGSIIRSLRLARLPQLINIVRGDMALVGPAPVRSEFAYRITELMPFYAHRFSVKPGILGWARMHAPRQTVADECAQVEYDLYYVREGSLWLDAEIVTGSFLGAH